jgi:hypothetical protein
MARKRKANYTISELREIFNLNTKDGKHHNKVFMPNELFENLNEALHDEEGNRIKEFKTSTHIAYAYSYTYLAHYMYRYCKYYYMKDRYTEVEIDEKMIKKIMGFPAKADAYTYLTKDKGGILKDLGYIRKVSDKPYHYEINEWNDPEFEYESELELPVSVTGGSTRNRKINYPVKAFHRTPESEEDCYKDGTYYEKDNTHQVNFDVFMYCMAAPELGVEGFYLYALCVYLNNKFFRNGFNCTHDNFARLSGMSIKEVKAQLKKLEERNMIDCDHKPFCYDKPVDKKTKANTYWICGIDAFANDESEFRKIPKQRKISTEQYEKEIGFVGEDYEIDNSVFIDNENPFEKIAS